MIHSIWIAKKNHLCTLIKKVSDCRGGDDILWLGEYIRDVIDSNKDDFERAIECFKALVAEKFHVEPKVLLKDKEVKPYESRFGKRFIVATQGKKV